MNFHVLNTQFQQLSAHSPLPQPLRLFWSKSQTSFILSVILQYASPKITTRSYNPNPISHLKIINKEPLIRWIIGPLEATRRKEEENKICPRPKFRQVLSKPTQWRNPLSLSRWTLPTEGWGGKRGRRVGEGKGQRGTAREWVWSQHFMAGPKKSRGPPFSLMFLLPKANVISLETIL